MSATANMQPYFILFNLGGFKCCGLYNSFMHLSLPVAMARDIQFLPLAGVVVGNINVSCKCTACHAAAVTMTSSIVSTVLMHNLHRMIHVAALQDYSHEDDGEPVRSLPSQAEHTVHIGIKRLGAEQKERMQEGAEEEDKQGCHADGSTHGLTAYNTKPFSDSMDDEDSSEEEELRDSADEAMDSDEDFSEEQDSHEECSEVRMFHPLEGCIL